MMSSLLLVCRWCHVLKVPVHAAHFECDSWPQILTLTLTVSTSAELSLCGAEWPAPPGVELCAWRATTDPAVVRRWAGTQGSTSAAHRLRTFTSLEDGMRTNGGCACVRAKHVANYCIAYLWCLRHQLISAVDIWLSVLLGRVGRSETNLSSLTVDHVYVCISVGDVYFCLQQVSFTCVQWTSNSCCNANEEDLWSFKWLIRWRYDTRCCFNVCSKADMSQLNRPHGKSYTCRHQCSRIHRVTVT